jgi:quercetin dioxygenase-like cupin family protein
MGLVDDTSAAAIAAALGQVGSRLRRLRTQRRIVIPTGEVTPMPRAQDGAEWIHVLSGHMRLVLGDEDRVLGPGEVAAFDTRVPHWFGTTGVGPAEILSIFGRPGEP